MFKTSSMAGGIEAIKFKARADATPQIVQKWKNSGLKISGKMVGLLNKTAIALSSLLPATAPQKPKGSHDTKTRMLIYVWIRNAAPLPQTLLGDTQN